MSSRRQRIVHHLFTGDRPDAPVGARFVTGAMLGAMFTVFTPLLLFLWAVGGRETTTRHGTLIRVDLLAALYPIGAIVTAALMFGLASFVRVRSLRALVGVVAFLPWAAAIIVCFDSGHVQWRALHTVTTLLMALAFGAPIGWRMPYRAARQRRQPSRRAAV